MQVNIHVDSSTLPNQFVALANLFRELSCVLPASAQPQQHVFENKLPVDSAELDEPEVVVAHAETKPAVTRRRRTKAELEAEKAALDTAAIEGSTVADAEAAAQASNEAELAKIEAQAANKAELAELAEIKAAEEAKVDEFEKVAATGSKTFTEAEAQQLATVIARTKGPQVVKDKIAELGAVRIGDLTADQLNELGNFLEAQK